MRRVGGNNESVSAAVVTRSTTHPVVELTMLDVGSLAAQSCALSVRMAASAVHSNVVPMVVERERGTDCFRDGVGPSAVLCVVARSHRLR